MTLQVVKIANVQLFTKNGIFPNNIPVCKNLLRMQSFINVSGSMSVFIHHMDKS